MRITPGPWKLISDAQGPCMVMHPTLSGVAIASLTDAHIPTNGFHDEAIDEPSPCPEAYNQTTYRPERVANARAIGAVPELLAAINFAYIRALQNQDQDSELINILYAAKAKAEGL